MATTLLLSIEARRLLGHAARPSSFDCAATVLAVLLCFRVAVAAFYAEFLLNFFSSSSRLAVRAADFYLTLGWATAYVLYAWAQYAQSGFWPYFFLDLSSWAAVGWYSLLIALFAAVYAMAVGGSALKARCAGLASKS
ncbi:hypothetical protein EMIHUDRAFT_456264 [Emiliania huxleyi CCMP1516]|uniref:MARVEL domain-containing protein n=2 Tax=Emiliania huxleyi TaxID=2903 RepID=A0A0D3K7B8_EMIH1|nr:hypothetical protein EMIHUDRAFT_456264 [Emiliania huxleyi CCMP1516]EOD31653.1 hypothetical protein EMIHUDRAFT_456264 [Emiliania huxleyi CCMP1516]|eukprot:XP_005784082.1 hypothetical protein EMIHUDRAFT_456264 [Emiliania huxleyi CCMP1516]